MMELKPLNLEAKPKEIKKPEKLTLAQAQKDLKSLVVAEEMGINVPKYLRESKQRQVWALSEVVEVWDCPKCPRSRIELYVRVKEMECRCGKIRKIWPEK